MHTATFYPLGNADTCLIELEKGKKMLFDYANMRDPDDESDKRVDVASELRNVLEAAKAGVSNYIIKPFTADMLQAKMEVIFKKP